MAKRRKHTKMKKKKYQKINTNFVEVFSASILKSSALRMKSLSEKFAQKVRTIIYKQMYNWKPLSEKYLEKKKREGLDQRILIATKKYVKSIKSIRKDTGRRSQGGVGVIYSTGPVGETTEGIPLTLLGRWLEYGTADKKHGDHGGKGMPPRPHWRPAWKEFLMDIPNQKRKLKKDILRDFGKNIKTKVKTKNR